jgi:hypothetical protein
VSKATPRVVIISVGFLPCGSRAENAVKKGLVLADCESDTLRRIVDYLEQGMPRKEQQWHFLFSQGQNGKRVNLCEPTAPTEKMLRTIERDIRNAGKTPAVRRALLQVARLVHVITDLQSNEIFSAQWGRLDASKSGGQKKQRNQSTVSRRRNAALWEAWVLYAKNKRARGQKPTVEEWWPLSAQSIYDRLLKADPAAAAALRGKGEHGFLTIDTVREIIKQFRNVPLAHPVS